MNRFLILVLVLAALGLALSAYGATALLPAPPPKAPAPSLSASRTVLLLPDGRVEISDAWARRVFRWDGRRWLEVSATPTPRETAAP